VKIRFVHFLINQSGKPHSPPLGPLYLVEVLRRNGFDVELVEYVHRRGTTLAAAPLTAAMDGDCDVVAVSCMINVLPVLMLALRALRTRQPHTIVVAGGPGFGGIAAELLGGFDAIDAVAIGESESIVGPLMRALQARRPLHEVPGLFFREGGKVVATARPPLVADLDTIPFPAFDLVSVKRYQHVGVLGTRGCPFRCTFCDVAPAWLRQHRKRSPENIVAELSWLHDKGVRRVGFVDDLFIIDRAWVRSFCRALLRSGLQMAWRCNTHVNLMRDESLLALMRDAGCDCVFFGIESGSDRILKAIKKGFSAADALDAVDRASKYFALQSNLIWGFPFETPDDVRATLDLKDALDDRGVEVALPMAAPLADSELYAACRSRIRFSTSAPNMFFMDYAEMRADERRLVERIIVANPHAMSAFHHFEYPHLAECVDLVAGGGKPRRKVRSTAAGRVKKTRRRRPKREEKRWFDFHQEREAR
jgi:radical SAM superfamily enzyme YgiQ (UPF0313 family)